MEINLVSGDGLKYPVLKSTACMCTLVEEMLEDEDEAGVEIPLPGVSGAVLQRVLEFCAHHEANPLFDVELPITTPDLGTLVGAWDAAFMDEPSSRQG